jgi:hypothetical protein
MLKNQLPIINNRTFSRSRLMGQEISVNDFLSLDRTINGSKKVFFLWNGTYYRGSFRSIALQEDGLLVISISQINCLEDVDDEKANPPDSEIRRDAESTGIFPIGNGLYAIETSGEKTLTVKLPLSPTK